MQLEQLAIELLLDTFEYLSGVDLLRAFSYINTRFNNLLIIHFRTHCLDFRSISKHDFNIITQQHLPWIVHHITSLRLSDDDDTPDQINLIPLHRFIQLKSLTLYHIRSHESMKNIVEQLRHLPLLTRFYLIDCHLMFDQKTIQHLCQLPRHIRCYLADTHKCPIPTIRAQSIEYFCTETIPLDFNQLIRLFHCILNLCHLTAFIDELPDNAQFSSIIYSLTSVKFIINHLTNGTIHLLKSLPNLTVLILQIGNHSMNGYQWEEFIMNHLPNLKIFRFLILFFVDDEQELDEIFNSYRTQFWLIDHQWFVRCHWYVENEQIFVYFYTLPYTFPMYAYILDNSHTYIKSTYPSDNDYYAYNHVKILIQHDSIFNNSFLSTIRFHNIRHFQVIFPIAKPFLSIFTRFNQLISLNISSNSEADINLVLSQLQTLIDRAPRLYGLIINHWDLSSILDLLLNITSKSIRRLDLQSYHYLKRDCCFNNEQCAKFLRSPLAQQCQLFQIVVDDQSCIDKLINEMPNLQALNVIIQSNISTETKRLWIR